MSTKSLIRKNQLHPDILDLVSGYTNDNYYLKSQIDNTLLNLSGTFVKKSGDETITGVKNFISKPTVNNIPILLSGEVIGGGTTVFNGNRVITRESFPNNINAGGEDVVTFLNNIFFPYVSASGYLDEYPIKEFGEDFGNVYFSGSILTGQETQIISITYQTGYQNSYTTVSSEAAQPIKTIFNYSNGNLIDRTINFKVNMQFLNFGGSPSPLIVSDIKTQFYEAPYYYGVSNLTGLNSNNVTSLLLKGSIVRNPDSLSHVFYPNNQYIYFVYPQDSNFNLTPWSYMTSIKDLNTNINYINNVNFYENLEVTVGNGQVVNYTVCKWKNLLNGGPFYIQFNF